MSYGVSWFGISLDVLNPNHLSINDAKEIIQWLHQPNIIIEIANHQTIEEIIFLSETLQTNSIEIKINHPQFFEIIDKYDDVWINIKPSETNHINDKLLVYPIVINVEKEEDIELVINLININNIYINCNNINWIKKIAESNNNIGICIVDSSSNDEIPYDLFEEILSI